MFRFLKTLILTLVFTATSLAGNSKYGPLTVSPEAKDLIVYYESGGETYYKKNLTKITWPGGASGATGGIGYDFGYNTKDQIAKDWAFLGPKSLALLQSTAGMKGQAGKAAAARIKPFVSISWADANKVFEGNTMPRFSKLTYDTFPGIEKTHPHVQGAVLSVVFNRGASLSGDSRKEMLDIKIHVKNKNYYLIPNDILAMRRLWVGKGLDGLIKRRVAEANLANRAFSK
jgi:hypothetical protein